MASIYDLTGSFQTLWNLMEEGTLDDEILQEVFENTTEELSIKLEGYCKFIKNLESDIAGLKAEEERLAARRKTMENTIKRSKEAMQRAMNVAGEKKLPCGSFTVSLQKSPASVVLDVTDTSEVPPRYMRYPEPEVDKAKIKEELSNGAELSFAHLESKESLRIR